MARRGQDDDAPSYPLLTNEPGVSLTDPVRRARLIGWVIAAMIGAATIAGSYVATTIAGDRTKSATEATLADMNRRTADRKASETATRAILEQNRRTLCSLMRDLRQRQQSNDEIEKLYVAYHCGTAKDPVVPPGWTAPPGWPALPPGPLVPPSGSPPAPVAPAGPPADATIQPPSSDQPTEPGEPAQPPTTQTPPARPADEGGTTP